jgi:hypothetical protein
VKDQVSPSNKKKGQHYSYIYFKIKIDNRH